MSITGTWNLTLNSPLGDQAARLDVTEVDGALQATLTGKGDPTPVQRLEVNGNDVSFAADADTPVGRLNLAFSGAVDGDKLAGKYQTPFGGFDFSGARA
ncbi:MAG: hypothetical protein NDI84_07655 [Steroidobacteraceae bacterium]|jgi:hypothetical protein|nr:hypothetical protein [Steroidobacteraceae bacterium]